MMKEGKKIIVLAAMALSLWTPGAWAGIEPFIGEISMVGFNYAPSGWAHCDGQLLAISSNSALFSLLGTTYGGDGRTTFALPDLRGRFPMHAGSGPGLTEKRLGWKGGVEMVTLNLAQLPSHSHTATTTITDTSTVTGSVTVNAAVGAGTSGDPANRVWALSAAAEIYSDNAPAVEMRAGSAVTDLTYTGNVTAATLVGTTGGSQAVYNMPPFTVVNFVIALQGIYPPRN